MLYVVSMIGFSDETANLYLDHVRLFGGQRGPGRNIRSAHAEHDDTTENCQNAEPLHGPHLLAEEEHGEQNGHETKNRGRDGRDFGIRKMPRKRDKGHGGDVDRAHQNKRLPDRGRGP